MFVFTDDRLKQMPSHFKGGSCKEVNPEKNQIFSGFCFLYSVRQIGIGQTEIHQHTPYLSIIVAQHLLHGSSPIGSRTTPPSLKT